MNKQDVRQEYLKLISRLFEFAAQYSREDLREIRDFARIENNRVISSAIGVLLELHGAPRKASGLSVTRDEHTVRPNLSRRRERILREILNSKEVFKTTSELAAKLPAPVSMKPKESRQRFSERVITYYRSLNSEDQRQFFADLENLLAVNSTGSFVSRWSSLIKEL